MKATSLKILVGSALALLILAVNVSALTVTVGDKNNLTCGWDRTDGPPITNYFWSVQGYAVSNFYVAPDVSTGMVVEPFPKTNSQVEFYWVDEGHKKVSCDIISMGQKLTADAKFQTIAPTVDYIGTINGIIAYDTNFNASRDGIKCLHFGDSYSNGVWVHGIDFVATNANLNGIDQLTSYGFFAVQTIGNTTHILKKTDGSTITTSDAGLDNTYPYQLMGEADGVATHDGPGVGYASDFLTNFVQFSASGNFRQVLMFQCYGGMPVPMKEICWNWSGTVTLTNSDWILTSSNAAITVNNHPTTTFPYWTNVVMNQP